jgi:hypothetical protein
VSLAPVSELAGLQEDPLFEFVLALLYSDAPVRNVIRSDTRRHWQWMARDPNESASFVWLTFAQPITDDSTAELEQRTLAGLEPLVPDKAKSVEAKAKVVRFDAIALTVTIGRLDGTTFEQTLILEQGVPNAT